MLWFDYAVMSCAVVVLLTLFMPWYAEHVHGATVTRRLLSGDAGIQRPLVPVVAGILILEGVANLWVLGLAGREWRYHRGVAFLLCVLNLILVGSSAASSPFTSENLSNLGIGLNPGLGAWLAIAGAATGIAAAVGRGFCGRPALTR